MQEVWALKDINFEIRRGEAVAIIGRNGSGKSTLLEILTGTLTPTTGEVKINGRVSALLELGSGFNPEYSGRDNVLLNGLLLGFSREEILNRFDEIESFAEIGAAIERPVKTYSSGMMMRLAFAVQVLCEPDILIIDEALSVGDFFFQQKCLGYLRGLCAKGVTLLFVSHDMGAVSQICSRAIYLRKGALKQIGDVSSVTYSYFCEKSGNEIPVTKPADQLDSSNDTRQPDHAKGIIWLRSDPVLDNKAGIISVAIFSEDDVPAVTFKLGSRMKVVVEYVPDPLVGTHLTIGLNDRYGKLCTATGTAQLRMAPKTKSAKNGPLCVEIVIHLLIEAGQYSLDAVLGFMDRPNSGHRFDITPSIGPINVEWDYETYTAPFIGQVGLPTSGRYIA